MSTSPHSLLRGNDRQRTETILPESAFAAQVLQDVGGSQVYIEKSKKFLETDE